MARVPQFGDFKMFNTASDGSIANALIEGGSEGTAVQSATKLSGSTQLIDLSTSSKYDSNFAGTISDVNADISSSEQWRGYPLDSNFGFTLKCVFNPSQSIITPDPDPDTSGSIVCVDVIATGYTGFANNSVGNITGSSGVGDNTYPVSSSYDIVRFAGASSNNNIDLFITTGSDTDDPPTFTSLTLSSSAGGETTLDYCDLNYSASTSAGQFRYNWVSSDANAHFVSDNCITFSFNTASVDYFVDCQPPISTTAATRTQGEIQQNKQIACDSLTITNIYFSSSDLDNGITVGDYVYTDANGYNPFNGGSKFYGLNTSSVGLNAIPDKIAQIVSNGLITALSDCVPTGYAYTDYTGSLEYDCEGLSTYLGNTNAHLAQVINNTVHHATASGLSDLYQETKIASSTPTTQSFHWSSYSRPNKFTAYDDSSTYDDPIYSTDWKGVANYSNTSNSPGGGWGSSLSQTAETGSATIKWGSTTGRRIRVDYGRHSSPDYLNDIAKWDLVCSASLIELTGATGSSAIEACRSGSIGDHSHYHIIPTGSWQITNHANNGPKVYQDIDANQYETSSGTFFSYTSSAGTRYYYKVESPNTYLGEITTHQTCSGTLIAAVHLTNQGDDCDDTNTLLSNRAYIDADWGGFVLSNGVLKVDNDNLGIANQSDQDLYHNAPKSGSIIHHNSITSAVATVHNTSADGSFLVAQNSLKNPSGTKILATVDDSTTPSNISFTPCSTPPGGGGCTEFDASLGFYASSFSGNDPRSSHCNNTFDGALFISMSGLIPQAGDGVHSSAACSGTINAPNTYYTIYNGTMNKTFIILMNGDGDEINTVWECTGQYAPSTGSFDYYLSTAFNDYGDNCGQDYVVSFEVTSDASSIDTGLHETVFRNGTRYNGRNKYYIVKLSSTTANGDNGSTHTFWQIDSNGVIQDVAQQTCGGSGGNL